MGQKKFPPVVIDAIYSQRPDVRFRYINGPTSVPGYTMGLGVPVSKGAQVKHQRPKRLPKRLFKQMEHMLMYCITKVY